MIFGLFGCSLGAGDGEVLGTVTAPECELNNHAYNLEPTFFAAEPVISDGLEIRIQHGSDLEIKSDGVLILVEPVSDVKLTRLGRPLEVADMPEATVKMALFMNETCPPVREDKPVHFEAVSGSIVFDNIYAENVSEDDVEVSGRFTDVHLVDPDEPDTRFADLNGSFRFFFNRGRPAQRFP
ncbi:MAG: hypothetical protein AAGF12_21725 [Myxococcota bacterium]